MREERDVAQVEPVNEPLEILDVLGEAVRIVLRLVGKTTPDMVDRHHPEVVQGLNGASKRPVTLVFTPHLTPMIRGIHATLYARLTDTSVDLQALFERAPPAASCRELGNTLSSLGQQQIAAGRSADVAYDAETGHGRTQGAVFP